MSTDNDMFLTPQETSDLTGYSLKALASHRSRKIGFPYYKMGRKIFYKRSEILAAIETNKVETCNGDSHGIAQ